MQDNTAKESKSKMMMPPQYNETKDLAMKAAEFMVDLMKQASWYDHSSKDLAVKAAEFTLKMLKRAVWYDDQYYPMYKDQGPDRLGKDAVESRDVRDGQ
jgi:hypothetical protein